MAKNPVAKFSWNGSSALKILAVVFVFGALGVHRLADTIHSIAPRLINHSVQFPLVLAVLFVLASYKPLVDLFRALDRNYQLISVALVALTVLGHFAHREQFTFPFATWAMFGHQHAATDPKFQEITFYEYVGTQQSGERIDFYPRRALPAAFSRIIDELTAQIRLIKAEPDPERRQRRMAEHEETVRALARLYNRHDAANPVVTVDVYEFTVPIEEYDYTSSSPVDRQFLWTIETR